MRRLGAVIAAVGFGLGLGCGRLGFDPGAGGDAASSDAGGGDAVGAGAFYRELTFQPTSFAGIVADFPAPVRISADPELAAAVGADEADIFFQTMEGQRLAYEVETYEPATGGLTAWVRLPELVGGAPTTVLLAYGGDEIAHDPADTWVDHVAVWHLAPADGVAADSARDADGELIGGLVNAPGLAGPCFAFDGINDAIHVQRPADGRLDFPAESFTVSMWVRATANQGPYDTVWWKGGSSSSFHGYTLELGTSAWEGALNDGQFFTGDFGQGTTFTGVWSHLAIVVDRQGAELRLFANATAVDTVALAALTSIASPEPASIGENYRSGNNFQGSIDEVRVQASARTDAWLRAEHESLTNPAFLTIGPQQSF
jgi:hypothetical protein